MPNSFHWTAACAATLALALAVKARAEEATILVSARAPLTSLMSGSSVSVLAGAELERLQAPLLVDVLALQPGVTVSRNGGPGGFTAVRLRGAEGEQTTLVIDGVKVADPASPGGGADFATIGTQHVARVEILRGPQSLAWGSQAIGGVIAIETEAPGEEPAASGRVEAGTRDSLLARVDAGARVGPVALSAGGNWQRTDGFSAASEARGATERDGFESRGGNLRADVELAPGLSADLRGRFQQSDVGLDGFPAPAFVLADTDARQRTREWGAVAGLGWRGEAGSARFGWQASDVRRRNYLPGEAPTFESDGRLERLDLRGDWRAAGWLTLAGGVEREVARIRTESSFDAQPFTARATLEGGWAQALLAPAEGLNLQGGVRHDRHSRFGTATTLAGAASWAVDERLRLRGSWGQGFKAPTLYQLFSDFGNATLRPERAEGWDVGGDLSLLAGGMRASATLFGRVTRDQIDFASCFGVVGGICTDRPFGTYDNVARTRARGVELVLGLRPTEGLSLDAHYTHVDARNRTAGSANEERVLARRPAHTVSLLTDWVAPAGWSVGATLAHVSGSFDDAANRRPIEGHVTADVRAAVPLSERVELYGRVTNLFDATYETASFYGAPGRQAFVGLRARL